MKTQKEHKQELFRYFNQTTNHLYEFKSKISNIEYTKRFITHISGDKLYVIKDWNNTVIYDLNEMFNKWKENTKCVIKHSIFADSYNDYKTKTIKQTKKFKKIVKDIDLNISNDEIKNLGKIIFNKD